MDWQGLEAEVFDNKSSRAVEQDEAALNKQRATKAEVAQKQAAINKQRVAEVEAMQSKH
jgi:hypothetical protein